MTRVFAYFILQHMLDTRWTCFHSSFYIPLYKSSILKCFRNRFLLQVYIKFKINVAKCTPIPKILEMLARWCPSMGGPCFQWTPLFAVRTAVVFSSAGRCG